jgi:hypothetical protein
LYPRNAANSTPIGGSCEIGAAAAAGTPCAVRPLNMVPGSLLARPLTMSEKKIPIDSTDAEFMNVAIMPPAAPRASAGTAFIISALFGDTNRPEPKPFSAMSSANSQ